MSIGSIPRQRKVADAQFVRDLVGLLKRHRIESAGAGGYGQFELNLASKDTFRSHLFTLCRAISHMADEDLSGEELLALIDRAMGAPGRPYEDGAGGMPESMRSAFLSGYDAWSNRANGEHAIWPERRPTPANGPIPFPQPTEAMPEPGNGLRVPGLPTLQEALLMAKKQAPFQLPVRVTPLPEGPATDSNLSRNESRPPAANPAVATPGTNVDNLTIGELTQLLEDIERRMSQIKPQFQGVNSPPQIPASQVDHVARPSEVSDPDAARAAMTEAVIRDSLLVSHSEILLTPLEAALTTTENVEDDAFVERHPYLNPERRRKLPSGSPAPLLAMPVPPPPAMPGAPVVPAADPVAAAQAVAPRIKIIPRTANEADANHRTVKTAIGGPPDIYRVLFHIAFGVLAAVILVAIPLAGMMAYRSSHSRYEYHDFQPAAHPAAASSNAAGVSSQPESIPAVDSTASKPATPVGIHKGRSRPAKRNASPSVAVWPPPPDK